MADGVIRSSAASALVLVTALFAGPACAQVAVAGVDPETGYRMENYRAPVPEVLPGGIVADLATAMDASRGQKYQLIDVYSKGAVPDPVTGEWTNMDSRLQIPGSVWLPNVGAGKLTGDEEAYFQRSLGAITQGDKARGLLFYCMSDCWQSWNAATRAIRSGYSMVAWYPLGTDGWTEAGHKLVPVKAMNFLGADL